MSCNPSRAERERGFTLVEVLVAFAVAAVLLVPLLRVFSSGLGGVGRADRAATAALWAQSLIAERDGEQVVAAGTEGGTLPGGYSWQRTVQRYQEPGMTLPQPSGLVPYDVTLSVTWTEAGHARAVSIETLVLGPITPDHD